jgi:hypothetical protein
LPSKSIVLNKINAFLCVAAFGFALISKQQHNQMDVFDDKVRGFLTTILPFRGLDKGVILRHQTLTEVLSLFLSHLRRIVWANILSSSFASTPPPLLHLWRKNTLCYF